MKCNECLWISIIGFDETGKLIYSCSRDDCVNSGKILTKEETKINIPTCPIAQELD